MTNFKTKSNRSILHPGEAPPPQGTPVKNRLRAKLAAKQEEAADPEFLKTACMALKKFIIMKHFNFPDDYKFRPGEYEYYAAKTRCEVSEAHPDIKDQMPKGVF